MSVGIDPEILTIGMELAVGHLDRGVKKFSDFAKVMVEDLGDVIHPYLKAFYNGARYLPEVQTTGLANEMTPYDEVSVFDVMGFDNAEVEDIKTDENGRPFVLSSDGTTIFGEITEDTGLSAAPIKLSEGFQDEEGRGYGLLHIEGNHGEQIRNAGFSSVKEFVSYVAKNYDKDNIRVGKQRNSDDTFFAKYFDKKFFFAYMNMHFSTTNSDIQNRKIEKKKRIVGIHFHKPPSRKICSAHNFNEIRLCFFKIGN